MRVVSLLPAATEWVCSFGAREDLVGRSHACDFPASVESVPVVTRDTLSAAAGADAVHRAVRERLEENDALYELDVELLRSLSPDLIITQAQCEVCAVSLDQLQEELRTWAEDRPDVLSMQPATLKEVLDAGLRIGRELGRMEEAMSYVSEHEKQLEALRRRLGSSREDGARPTVACIEWTDPLMTAGHWTADLVEHAGGTAVLSEPGAPSRQVAWSDLLEADPDVIAVLPCGYTVPQIVQDLPSLLEQEAWRELRSVREGRVFLLDGQAYFNRPGPRLYRSIELMASALHPAERERLNVEEWEMINLGDIGRW